LLSGEGTAVEMALDKRNMGLGNTTNMNTLCPVTTRQHKVTSVIAFLILLPVLLV
jgi:hypothetical protein